MQGPSPTSRTPTIGFAILSHRDPAQVSRLIDRLARLYPEAPIALHHDHSQTALPPDIRSTIARHASIVEPHVQTRWGRWSLVQATLIALDALLDAPSPPQWITLLSASDYPVAPPASVLAELHAADADAFLEARPVTLRGPEDRHLRKRYLRQTLWLGDAHRALQRCRLSTPASLGRAIGPFGKRLTLHWGPQWFTCNLRAARAIVASPRTHRRLVNWMKRTHIPDESFIHTLIMNTPGLRVAPSSRRFTRWRSFGAPSPETLTIRDLDAIRASHAHFARKFRPDDPALDDLDRSLGL